MAKMTYTATHNGQTYTRKSARTYTHAVIVDDAKPGVWGFAGRLDLAEKAAAQAQKAWPNAKIVIVPAVVA